MQKKLVLVAAVAGALAAPAAMADVRVSGLVDVGIQSVDPGSGYDGSKIHMTDNMGAGGSRLNFTASEDLGGGLKAIGVAELGWNIDSGQGDSGNTCPAGGPINACTSTSLSPGKTFQRQTWAGLAGGFGTVALGRQYREIFLAGARSSYNYTASGIGVFWLNTGTGVRQDNMIKYTSPTIGGGVKVAAAYAPGEGTAAANKDNDKFQEFSASWSSGPLSLNAAVGTSTAMTAGTGVDTKTTIVGGHYMFGAATVYALYSQSKVDGGAEAKATSVTGKYRVGNGDIVLAIGNKKVSPGSEVDSSLLGLGYFHWLSKTTNLFFTYGAISNDANVYLTAPRQASGATAGVGEDPTVIAVGWVQRF